MSMKFSEDHEWVLVEDGIATIGITGHAQEQLGDIVFVELPEVGKELGKGEEAAVVESVKAASEIYAPISGAIIAVNEVLSDAPETVNGDAMGAGWFFKISVADAGELEEMMDKAAYDSFVESQG